MAIPSETTAAGLGTNRFWLRWLTTRVLQVVPVLVGVVLFTFLLLRAVPGDPVAAILGIHATPASTAQLRHTLNLDAPWPEQLWSFVTSLAHGDLGSSLVQPDRSVASIVFPAMGKTMILTAVAVVFSVVIGVPIGAWSALSRSKVADVVVRSSASAMLATPPFLLGFFLLLLVALKLGAAPVGGWGSGPAGVAQHVWLPAIALAGYLAPIVVRSVRQSALETLEQDFVEAAVARGTKSRLIALRHVLPNSLLPVITLVGFNVGGLISGAVVIEAVFNIPATGTILVQAVDASDYPIVQGVALEAAVIVIVVTLITDLLYLVADPRLRVRGR